jgi:hypothetical protein
MNIKKFFRNAAFSLLGVGLVGMGGPGNCGNWQTDLENELSGEGLTHEQAEVGAAEGLKRVFADKVERDDSTVIYKHNYDVIKDSEILAVIEGTYADVKGMLDFGRKNISWLKYLQNTGRGEHLKKQEKIYKYKMVVLREKKLHRKFKKLVGESSYGYGYDSYGYGSSMNQFKIKDEEKYSLVDIFPINREKREFDTDDVRKARERGDLKDSEKIIEEILTKYEFFEKVENPQSLVNYGEKKWFFKKRITGIKIVAYNLDNDKEKKADYIEVFRFKKDGTTESKPAVKVFKPSSSDSLEIVVADSDSEGEGGYGMPDYVGRQFSIGTARDLMEHSQLLDFIFRQKKEEEKREWPEIKDMNKIYIVEAGTLSMNPFECNGCWNNFLPEYKTHPDGRSNSYIVHVRREISDDVNEEDKHQKSFPLKWIALDYNGGSRVVEFYKPKEEFQNKKYRVNTSGNKITLEGEDGQLKSYNVKAVIEDKPYQIDFDRNQQKRWEILDKDGDQKCYECKRERARPDEVIPKR